MVTLSFRLSKMKLLWASIIYFLFAVMVAEISMGVTNYFHNRISQVPLADLGHSTLPEFWIGHYTLLSVVIGIWYFGVMTLFWRHVHGYSIYTLHFLALGTLLLMRSFSIMVTVQPSPFGHLPPPEWAFSYRNVFPNLGDNMFSAHTCFATIPYICFADFYAKPVAPLFVGATFVWAFQIFWIIASHLHYTADVVIALYLCFTLWFALRGYVPFPLPKEKTMKQLVNEDHKDRNKLYI
jgi:hypothetical protein